MSIDDPKRKQGKSGISSCF